MLTLTRTANAGVLLELDGTRILLDGVCREVVPYTVTPETVKEMLKNPYPDVLAFTHHHPDHYDIAFAAEYEEVTGRKPIDPTFVGSVVQSGEVTIRTVASRHIGGFDCPHCSFVVEGSDCVWFMGDASPNQWKNCDHLPAPDVVIAPYAYATTDASWRMTKKLGAAAVVLVHLPKREKDDLGLWAAVDKTVAGEPGVFIPKMEEFVKITF